jgi:ribonuclease-3
VIATHGAAHSQQFEVECSVPELDIKVLGNGASRRAAEQVAANLALALVRQTTPRVAKRTRASRPVKKKTETDPQLLLKLKS